MTIPIFASGFFVGLSVIFVTLYGIRHGFNPGFQWVSSDFWYPLLAFAAGSVFAAFSVRSWQTTNRKAFLGGLCASVGIPAAFIVIMLVILCAYSWITEGNPIELLTGL